MVEIYENRMLAPTYRELLHDTLTVGRSVYPRGKGTKELTDVILRLDGDEPLIIIPGRTKVSYLMREFFWYLTRDTNAAYIGQHAKMWLTAANPDGTVNSNYGDAILSHRATGFGPDISEMEWVVSSLVNDPDTRQAVMVIHRPDHHWPGNKDVPCTLNMRFRIRDDKLEAWAHMRSCDLWWGLPYDANWFKLIHRAVFAEVLHHLDHSKVPNDLRIGDLHIQLDSAHLYERHFDQAQALLADHWETHPLPMPDRLADVWVHLATCVSALDNPQVETA